MYRFESLSKEKNSIRAIPITVTLMTSCIVILRLLIACDVFLRTDDPLTGSLRSWEMLSAQKRV